MVLQGKKRPVVTTWDITNGEGLLYMKKKILYVLMIILSGIFLTACTNSKAQNNKKNNPSVEDSEEVTEEYVESTQIPVSDADTETVYAKKQPNAALAAMLIDYYQIPEEYQSTTRYYYDDIDLNDDGEKEVIVVVVGEYTECDGGDPALILKETADGYEVIESFAYIRTPVYVSNTATDGWHDLIVPSHGGEEKTGFRIFHYKEGAGYQNDAQEFVEDMDPEFCGMKILANNFIDDMDKGNYLTLDDGNEPGK